ncbi:MAG: hypothetical protein WA435_08075 [Gallionellaceae bacterium]
MLLTRFGSTTEEEHDRLLHLGVVDAVAAHHLHRLADAPHIGGIIAGALFVSPSLFILIALSWVELA